MPYSFILLSTKIFTQNINNLKVGLRDLKKHSSVGPETFKYRIQLFVNFSLLFTHLRLLP